MKKIIINVLKIALGSALILYVLQARLVDFKALKTLLFNPVNLLVSFFFLFLSSAFCALRWNLLIKTQKLNVSFRNVFELTMIGNFFNTFMPGSVGGDLIKAWYIAGEEPKQKTKAVFTVLVDRIIGLSVILFYASVTLVFFPEWLDRFPVLKPLAYSLWGFTSLSVTFTLLFLGWKQGFQFLKTIQKSSIKKLIDSSLLYQQYPREIFLCFIFSFLSITGTIWLYQIFGQSLGLSLTLEQYLFVVPVGLTVSAIPLLPGGIGVGQVAFYTLFQWIKVQPASQGATLCTLMQIYTILFNCVGLFFYVKYKRKPAGIRSNLLETSSSVLAKNA